MEEAGAVEGALGDHNLLGENRLLIFSLWTWSGAPRCQSLCPVPTLNLMACGLGPLPTVASVSIILVHSAAILMACGQNPGWHGSVMNALWSGPSALGLAKLIFWDCILVHPRGLSPISLVGVSLTGLCQGKRVGMIPTPTSEPGEPL